MKLSIVIVNYNVEHFLEQCLHSVFDAIERIEAEVWVVDNNSVDGSLTMIAEKFPKVKLIANKENLGFSKANNQAIRLSKAEYVLLLNPDTVVEQGTFEKVVKFMDEHPDAGGLGVKMVDGKGRFLPESKRGLPTPEVAFYKIFGLSKLFSNSKRFGKYHLTFLDNNQIHQVDVLSGAFMLLRNSVLENIGLLDEDYFMYGEDIDLSYRILKAGYKNYYFPETRIIHYKGESTKKGSLNYVFVFYNAMIIFAKKHFSSKHARLFSLLIQFAIYLRAGISIAKRFAYSIWQPLLDSLVMFFGIYFLAHYWENTVLSNNNTHFPDVFFQIAIPIYVFIWIFGMWLTDSYERKARTSDVTKGVLGGTIAILVFYALLPESYRFSRAMIILGATWSIFSLVTYRYILSYLGYRKFNTGDAHLKRFLILGSLAEAERVAGLLRNTTLSPDFIGFITPQKEQHAAVIGDYSQIEEIITIYDINEVVFCAVDIPSAKIIDLMGQLQQKDVDFKIAPPESLSIIGSNSINTSGDVYIMNLNSITLKKNKRKKRFFDIIASLLLLLTFPIVLVFNSNIIKLLKNIFSVLFGKKTWIGLNPNGSMDVKAYNLREGILYATDYVGIKEYTFDLIDKANEAYCRNFKLEKEIQIFLKLFGSLGR
jgi:GT2 family glycosyltransferase